MSDRTTFTNLPLLGQGTGQVQSLSNYVEHLALAHNLSPIAVVEESLRQHPLISLPGAVDTIRRGFPVDAGAPLSRQLLERIQLATGTCLHGSTFQPLAQALATRDSFETRSLYCPVCVQRDDPLPYGRLIWEISFLNACPIHGVQLRRAGDCGAPMSERLPRSSRPTLKGVCRQCGSIGFRCITAPPQPAGSDAVFVARQVERVIAAYQGWSTSLDRDTLMLGIRRVVDAVYAGKPVTASVKCGFAKATVGTWLRETKPSLPALLQFCFRAGADPVSLLYGRYQPHGELPASSETLTPIARTHTRVAVPRETLRERLVHAVHSQSPPALRAFARANGAGDEAGLRRRFPLETALLVKARKEYLDRSDQERFELALAAYTRAALSLVASGRAVHRKSLTAECGIYAFTGSTRNGSRLKALATVLARFATRSRATNAPALSGCGPKVVSAVHEVILELNSIRSRA